MQDATVVPEVSRSQEEAALSEVRRACLDLSMRQVCEQAAEIVDHFWRALDMAAELPGGWALFIDALKSCERAEEVKAFCRAFTMVVGSASPMDEVNAVHDPHVPGAPNLDAYLP